MSVDTLDYAFLAKDAYQDRPEYVDDPQKTVQLNGHTYTVFDYRASPDGFHATAYKQVDPPHAIVIAYRGTDPDAKHHTFTTIQDVATDAIMVADKANVQANDAVAFAQKVMAKAEKQGIPTPEITVTGHSLGGTLAEIAASKCHLRGQTFNAYGAADLGLSIPQGGDQIIDNVLAGDVVSAGRHFGQVVEYATTADIDSLRRAGYLDGLRGIPEALRAMRLSDHGGDNFAPDPGKGASVLTPENQARAREYAVPIAHYREDVQHARTELHLATKLPLTPLWGVARTAETVEAATTLGQAALPAVEHAAHAVEHAAISTSEAVKRAYQQASHAVGHAAVRTDGVIEHTAQRAGHLVEHAASSLKQDGAALFHRAEHFLHSTSLDEATHPAHALYQSARAGVHQMEAQRGISHGEHSTRLAGAITVAALHQGMAHIDQVRLSDDGERAFGVQGMAPFIDFNRMAIVETATAVRTPLAQYSAQAETAYSAWQQQIQQQRPAEEVALTPIPAPHQQPSQGFSR